MARSRTLASYLAAFALTLTLPVLAAALVATYQFAASERSRLEALANDANQDIVRLIDREVSVLVAMLEALAIAFSWDEGGIDHFDAVLRAHALKTGKNVVMVNAEGQQIVNTRVARGSPLPVTADPSMLNEWAKTKRAYISGVFRGSTSRQLQVQVAVPVFRADRLVAVISAIIPAERLVELLREGLPQGPFYATILDRSGAIIARSVEPENFIGKPFPALAAVTVERKGTFSLVNPQGVAIYGYYRRPEISNWVVAAAVDHAALTTPLNRSLQILALVAGGLAALAMGGAWWIGRRLTRAHGALAAAAQALGHGLPVPPPNTGLREANMVGDAMAVASLSIAHQSSELALANQQLEERVASRTRDLSEKTALLQTTVDTMNEGVMIISETGRIALSNRRTSEMLGLPEELLGKAPSLDELLAFQRERGEFAEPAGSSEQAFRDLPEAGLSAFQHRRPDGARLDVLTVPIRGGRGFLRTFLDVTEQHRHAHDLVVAKDAAEQANRAKDDFLANMSHEMRTPLNAVIGFSEQLLRCSDRPTEVLQGAQRIQSAGVALLCLVDDILDLGKIEAGIIDVRTDAFGIDDLLEDAAAMIRPMAAEKGLDLTVASFNSAGASFLGDRDRLRQVLVNLLNNAVKFTPAGSVTLTLARGAEIDGAHTLRFSVIDTGIGIAKNDQPQLFQRFCQLDRAPDRSFGGAGLGLAICRQLVERMGGAIGVDSEPGRGSTFWFEVHLLLAEAQATERSARPSGPAMRILVADDATLNQELARTLLEQQGHQVDIVSNGLDAIEAAENGAYDMILMDMAMPLMDGIAATQRIRSAGSAASCVPIVACTANARPTMVSAMREAGADAYLRKPLRPAELRETIARVLSRQGGQRENDGVALHEWRAADKGAGVVSLLGANRVMRALDELTAELRVLRSIRPKTSAQRQRLADKAHSVISIASVLEFTALAECCRDVENACRDSTDVREAFDQLTRVVAIALQAGEQMRSDLQHSVA